MNDLDQNNHHKSSDYRYLEKLEFKPELRKTWLNFFVVNFRVVVLMIVLLSAWGIYSFMKLPRESNPEVKIPYASVVTTFPGASPSDVEELITKKIETSISGVKGIKKITSNSSNSVSAITVEFDTSQNQDDALRSLRDKVNSIKDLPDDSNDPQVNEVSIDDRPILSLSLTGPYDGFVLRDLGDKIKDELEKISGVREVSVSGGDEREFEVAYDPGKLALLGVSVGVANQAVANTNHAIPGGNFSGEKFNYPVRTDSRFFDEEALGNIPVLHTESGSVVYLRDVAEVKEQAIKKTNYSRFSIGGSVPENAINIDIVKKTGGSVIDTVKEARSTMDLVIKNSGLEIKYDSTTDFAKIIDKDFTQLSHDFLLTLILVMGVLFLIVGLKEAIVAGLAIPLVFFFTFGVMLATGITLNFLSIFSLLLALGLLVDDAIVVVSATKQYMKTGKYTPEEAVLLVLNDFKVVLTTTTLATTWAFLPLLMSTGIIGEYIKSIPITVSVTLVSSLLIALMINHPLAAILERIRLTKRFFFSLAGVLVFLILFLCYHFSIWNVIISGVILAILFGMLRWYFGRGKMELTENEKLTQKEWKDDDLIKKKLREQGTHENASFLSRLVHGIVRFDKLIPIYEKYLRQIISTKKRRVLSVVATGLIFVGAMLLPILGIVPSEFFPPSDQENIYVNVEAPIGLRVEETDKIVRQIEERLLKYPEVVNFSTVVGRQGISADGESGGSGGAVSHLAGIVLKLVDSKERNITSYDLATKIREDVSNIKGATITVDSPRGGPPSGAAFQAQIAGDDLPTLGKIAEDLKPILASVPGVVNISSSLKDAPAEYTFRLDPVKMEFYNLNSAYVGSVIRTAISGTEVTTVIEGNKEIKVMARFADEKIPDLTSLQNLEILNLRNQPVFLKDVADIELSSTLASITRVDQKRTVLLTSGVEGKTNSNAVVAEFQKKLASEYQLPDGYSITYGGENEQNQESVLSIIRAMVIAGILIISTLIVQFNSFKKSMIVLVTLPLALIGVFVGMAIFHLTLSFPGLIGILALFGIVVKNAIILIDKINLNVKIGIPFEEAIIDAGKSRLEAIFITSICTIFGIIPVTLSNETWTALGSAIIFGLMLSSFLTLFIIPLLFRMLVKNEDAAECI